MREAYGEPDDEAGNHIVCDDCGYCKTCKDCKCQNTKMTQWDEVKETVIEHMIFFTFVDQSIIMFDSWEYEDDFIYILEQLLAEKFTL